MWKSYYLLPNIATIYFPLRLVPILTWHLSFCFLLIGIPIENIKIIKIETNHAKRNKYTVHKFSYINNNDTYN